MNAVGLANNLLAAMLDNHIHHGNELGIDVRRIQWRRVVDMNDRALRDIVASLGGPGNGYPREDGFDIVVASEVMAIFCLATSLVITSYSIHYTKLYEYLDTLKDRKDGKLILVTAISPTPAGEGKTTTTVGLGDALNHIGKKAMICLREPSLGPVFGVKGGAAGGGYAQVVPVITSYSIHYTKLYEWGRTGGSNRRDGCCRRPVVRRRPRA